MPDVRPSWHRRAARLGAGMLSALLLSGCAALNTLDAEVSSHTQWPAARAPGTYAYERLPSQQAQPQEQAALEQAARPALARAGFSVAADPAKADVTVQLSLRVNRQYDPAGEGRWRWGVGMGVPIGRYGGIGATWRLGQPVYYDREVAVLIRDRSSGQPLYETRARNDGLTAGGPDIASALFDAALMDFPKPALNPRQVRVQVPKDDEPAAPAKEGGKPPPAGG
jgi:hypothetical protein